MNKEAFIKYYQLIVNDGQEPENLCEYIIHRSKYVWEAVVVYHSSLSSNTFDVFDRNQDGVIDFAEFLFMLACKSNSDVATKYGYLFDM